LTIVGIHNSSPPGTGASQVLRGKNLAGRFHCHGLLRFKQDGCTEWEQRTRLREQSGRDWNSTGGEPMVLDMATSAMPIFKVAEALLKGETLPPNVGYDAAGVPTQAPKEILVSGALMTFDRGPKSSGLALIVELLANALTGGCLPGDPDNQN
jgi:malate/lactate dehydrogenase-like protein